MTVRIIPRRWRRGAEHTEWRDVSWAAKETALIPTVLALGLVGGLLTPRRGIWVVIAATFVWIIMVFAFGDIDSVGAMAGAAAFGAANAVVGFALGWVTRSAAERLVRLK